MMRKEVEATDEGIFRHMLDGMLEGVQMHDFNWRYIYVNDASVNFSPYSREELLGYTLMEKYPGIEQSRLFKTLSRCMQMRVAAHLETDFIFPDGTTAFFELQVQPIPEGISILSVDKTKQKTAQELVVTNEKRFRALIENSADMITLSSREGKVLYCSPSVRKVFGYSLEEIRDTRAANFVHPDDIDSYVKNRNRILQAHGMSYSCEIRLLHRNGNWIWCEATLRNMLDEPGINALVSNFRNITERKKAQQAEIETKNLVQTIYSASLDAVIIINECGIITKWDAKSEKLFGWTETEVAGKELSETIIPLRYREMHNNGMKHYLKTGEGPALGKTIDISALKKDGSEFDISLSITTSQIDGKLHFIGFIRDISEKKLAENQREFDEKNFNALINNTTDLMWSVDVNAKLITFNQPFYDIIRHVSGKEVAKGDDVFSAVLSPEQLSRFKISYARALAGEAFTQIEYIDAPVESWSEISYYPIRKEDKIIGVACHSRDITQRKKDEVSLILSEKRLKEAQEIAHVGSWTLNFGTGTGLWSEESCRIYGLPLNETTQTQASWLSFIHPDDLDRVQNAANEAKKKLRDLVLKHRILLKDGTVKYVVSRSKFEFDKHGKPIGLYGIVHDITEEMVAEKEKEKMTAELVRRNQNLEQFTYIVSHNLRAPLANIMGATGLLNSPSLSATEAQHVSRGLSVSAGKLDEVVRDLNYILQVKQEIGETKVNTSFSELTEDIKLVIAGVVDNKQAVIKCDFSAIDEMITCKSYLYSIFYNLISNSVKYRQPQVPAIIQVRSRLSDNRIILTFSDNGMGIDLTKKGQDVFGLYKKFHPGIEGKGMGLFMVKTQVETLGGKISVRSEVNKGSEFTIEFENDSL